MVRLNKVVILLIIISFFSRNTMNGCSCHNVPNTFTENLTSNQIIFHAKVIKHIKAPRQFSMFFHGITELEVLNEISGQLNKDTIYFTNESSASCGASIEKIQIENEILIKSIKEIGYNPLEPMMLGFRTKITDESKDFMKEFKNKILVRYEICDYWFLEVKRNKVIGAVTNNPNGRKIRKEIRLSKKGNRKAEKLEQKRIVKPTKKQKMKLTKAIKVIRRKLKKS